LQASTIVLVRSAKAGGECRSREKPGLPLADTPKKTKIKTLGLSEIFGRSFFMFRKIL
jgi:hypothetical protein